MTSVAPFMAMTYLRRTRHARSMALATFSIARYSAIVSTRCDMSAGLPSVLPAVAALAAADFAAALFFFVCFWFFSVLVLSFCSAQPSARVKF